MIYAVVKQRAIEVVQYNTVNCSKLSPKGYVFSSLSLALSEASLCLFVCLTSGATRGSSTGWT